MNTDSLPDLVCVGDPIIRQNCQPIADMELARQCCRILTAKLRVLVGAGLAAPQLGMPWRIFVVEIHKTELFPDRTESPLYELINPELRVLDAKIQTDWEGCFSLPTLTGMVPRAGVVEVKYLTFDGVERTDIFHDYPARVMQHEMDHLNGMVYLDRMSDMQTISTRDNYRKRMLEQRSST